MINLNDIPMGYPDTEPTEKTGMFYTKNKPENSFTDNLFDGLKLVGDSWSQGNPQATPNASPEPEQEPETQAAQAPDIADWNISTNNGDTVNALTGQVEKGGTASQRNTNEFAESLEAGDEDVFTNQFLRKLGHKDATFDYKLKSEKDVWKPALTQFAISGLLGVIAAKQGMSKEGIANMVGTSMVNAGRLVKQAQDRIGRQAHIDALEAKGYLEEDIMAWLDSGDEADLVKLAKERGAMKAQSREKKTGYYQKGDKLPNGETVKKDGTYEITYTDTLDGVPQIAMVHYAGDAFGLEMDSKLQAEREKIKAQQDKGFADAQSQARTMNTSAQSTLDQVNAITASDISNAGGWSSYGGAWSPSSRSSVAKFDQILAGQFMDNISQMKGMGSLSNAEGSKVTAAATALVDPETNTLRTGLDEDFIREQLGIIKNGAQRLQRVSDWIAATGREPSLAEERALMQGNTQTANPSPANNVPQVGTVDGGYMFRGGNPSDPANWVTINQ